MSRFAGWVLVAAVVAVVGGAGLVAPTAASTLKALVLQQQTAGPVATVVGFDPKGASSISTCDLDLCEPTLTDPVRVKVPSAPGSYQAHVTISLDYRAVGKLANEYLLRLRTYPQDAFTRSLPVLPKDRRVKPGKSTTTIDFWVRDLKPGTTYVFEPAGASVWPRDRGTYLSTYRVLTRVDILKAA